MSNGKRRRATTEANAQRKRGYFPTMERPIVNINQIKGAEKRKMREAGLI